MRRMNQIAFLLKFNNSSPINEKKEKKTCNKKMNLV